jgi:hypothetical protein
MGSCHRPGTVTVRQERRFPGDVRQTAELGREPVAAGRDACPLLGEGDDRIPSKGRQPFVSSEVREEPRVGAHALLVARDRGFEIRQHLEQLSEVRVMRVEHGVERRIAEQNRLDGDVDGLRLEQWACPPRREFGGPDLQATGAQRANEHLPGARFREDITGLQDEETAVGLQERPRVDYQMIGMDHASRQKLPLDETQQVRHGWRTLDDGRVSKVEMAMFTPPVQRHIGSQTSQ